VLKVEDVHAGYGNMEVLHGVSVDVVDGECVAILGRNGAGKTTLMHTISGVLRATRGRIEFGGRPIERRHPAEIAHLGIAYVQEGRRIFHRQSVLTNLNLGAYAVGRSRREMEEELEHVYEQFPALSRKRNHSAGLLSGGEQQMLAIGQALMAKPTLLLLDEPSAGLAPPLVIQLFQALKQLAATGIAILLAEQQVGKALEISQRVYVLDRGSTVLAGNAKDMLTDNRLVEIYMAKERP
jgi:branched-chain amino acid transport system ATP-binding protein